MVTGLALAKKRLACRLVKLKPSHADIGRLVSTPCAVTTICVKRNSLVVTQAGMNTNIEAANKKAFIFIVLITKNERFNATGGSLDFQPVLNQGCVAFSKFCLLLFIS